MRSSLRHGHVNWALADQILVSGVNFAIGILLARYLGLAEFGRYSLIWLVVLFAQSIQQAFVTTPMVTLGPKTEDAERRRAYYGAVLMLQILFAAASGVSVWLVLRLGTGWQAGWRLDGLELPLAAVIVTRQLQEFVRRQFYADTAGRAVFVNDCVAYGALLVIIPGLAYADALRLDIVFEAIAVSAGTAAILGLIAAGLPAAGGGGLVKVIRRHWRFARWLVATALLQWFGANYFFLAACALDHGQSSGCWHSLAFTGFIST